MLPGPGQAQRTSKWALFWLDEKFWQKTEKIGLLEKTVLIIAEAGSDNCSHFLVNKSWKKTTGGSGLNRKTWISWIGRSVGSNFRHESKTGSNCNHGNNFRKSKQNVELPSIFKFLFLWNQAMGFELRLLRPRWPQPPCSNWVCSWTVSRDGLSPNHSKEKDSNSDQWNPNQLRQPWYHPVSKHS